MQATITITFSKFPGHDYPDDLKVPNPKIYKADLPNIKDLSSFARRLAFMYEGETEETYPHGEGEYTFRKEFDYEII